MLNIKSEGGKLSYELYQIPSVDFEKCPNPNS